MLLSGIYQAGKSDEQFYDSLFWILENISNVQRVSETWMW